MKATRFFRQTASVVVAIVSSVFASVLFSPSAFALVVKPVGDGSTSGWTPQPAPTITHAVVTGGMAVWQIVLIAVGAALVAATSAILVDRAREAHRRPPVATA